MGLLTAAECADWWASLVRDNLTRVETWVESKGYGANTTAGFCLFWGTGSLNTAADLLLIDNLRLGSGAGSASAGGTKWGYLEDLGRAAAFIPLAKAPGMAVRNVPAAVAKTEAGVGKVVQAMGDADQAAAKLATGGGEAGADGMSFLKRVWHFLDNDPAHSGKNYLQQVFRLEDEAADFGVCWAVSLAQGLRHSGRYFIKLDDIAKLLGFTEKGAELYQRLEQVRIIALKQMGVLLEAMKVPYKAIDLAGMHKMGYGITEILEAATPKNLRGVLLFGVRWGDDAGHMLYAARSADGSLKIFDRGGDIVKSLSDLERYYPGISKATMKTVDQVIFIPDAKIARGLDPKHMGPFGALLLPVFFKSAIMGGGDSNS